MTLLAIDTAGPRLQLALLRYDVIDTLIEPMQQGQAERIFPAIAALLGRNSATYRDLNRIAVTTGPGSFTGLRIGLSAARGLGLALGIPVVGIPTLLAISLAAQAASAPFTIRLDARRGEEYVQSFAAAGAPEDAPRMMPQGDLLAGGRPVVSDPQVPIEALARFALTADPAVFPPDPTYIRDADAKPQERFRVALQ